MARSRRGSFLVAAALVVLAACAPPAEAGAEAGDLLIFESTGRSLLVKRQSGATVAQVALPTQNKTRVLPGAVSADGKYAFNPAVGSGTPGPPSLVVTDLSAATVKVVATVGVPSPQGLAGCTFDNTTLGGPLVAVGNLSNAENYPLALVLRCQSQVCTDSYLASYDYDPASKTLMPLTQTHLQTLPSYAFASGHFGIGPACVNEPANFGGGVYQPANIFYDETPYLIATQQSGSSASTYGAAALFQFDGNSLSQLSAQDAFDDTHSAACANFVWLRDAPSTSPSAVDLAASCALQGPGATTVIHTSSSLSSNDFDQVNATAHSTYVATAAVPKSLSLVALTKDGSTWSVSEVTIERAGAPLHNTPLFSLPSTTGTAGAAADYAGIAYIG